MSNASGRPLNCSKGMERIKGFDRAINASEMIAIEQRLVSRSSAASRLNKSDSANARPSAVHVTSLSSRERVLVFMVYYTFNGMVRLIPRHRHVVWTLKLVLMETGGYGLSV